MEYRIYIPLLLKRVDLQPAEQFFLSEEIAFQGGQQQTLAKPARSAQEEYFPVVCQVIYHIRLIDIYVSVLDYVAECLYSYRVFHHSKYWVGNKLNHIHEILLCAIEYDNTEKEDDYGEDKAVEEI